MKVKNVKVSTLVPYENNPRNNDGAVDYVANSIKQFGFKVPIVIDKDNVIVSGHTRYRAAMQLGLEEVPVIVADDLTPEQIKAFRLADNKTAEKASWDYSKLGKEVEDLLNIDLGFNLTDIGFGEFELEILKGDFEPAPYNDEEIKEYTDNEKEFLARERVIITFDPTQKERLAKILGVPELTKVAYGLEEILALRGE